MKVIRIMLLKIVNQSMENIDKILEKDTGNLTRSPGSEHLLLSTYISLLNHFSLANYLLNGHKLMLHLFLRKAVSCRQ